MRVTLAAVADYASVTADNKLNILGIFSQVNWTGTDTVVPMMYAVFVLEAEPGDYETERSFRIVLTSPSDQDVVQTPEAVTMIPPEPPQGRLLMNQVAGLVGVPFTETGTYHVTLLTGDERLFTIDLPVVDTGGGD